MSPTEKYKRAESLFNDRTKRELADMVVHREADLEDARAENEHMRLKALAFTGELQEESERLKAENVKLRELAERAWKAAERLCQAFDGPCKDDGVTSYKPCPMGERDEECVYGQLQRELRECGVEVDV